MVPKDEMTENSMASTNTAKLAENDNETPTDQATDRQASNGDHINAITPSLAAKIEGHEPLAAENGVKLNNPSIPTNGHAEEEVKEHSGTTVVKEGEQIQPEQTETEIHVIDSGVSAITGSGCPFLGGQQ